MARKLLYAIFSIGFLLCSCMEKEDFGVSHGLMLDFSLEGNASTKADEDIPVSFEDKVTHLDVFFFGNDEKKFHYERIITDGNPSGEKAITGITLTQLKEKGSVKIYVVANSKLPVGNLSGVTNIDGLKNLKEETTYINLTGYTGFEYDIPMTFLMTGLATAESFENLPDESTYNGVDFSGVETTENYKLKVRLIRAAAKVEMHFKKNNDSNEIYAFGLPKIYETGNAAQEELNEIELDEFTEPEDFSYIHNSYYVRNLRYITNLWGSNTDITAKRKTNPITNSGYMTANKTGIQNVDGSVDEVKVTAYIYSYTWGGTDQSEAIFENAPFLVVNLPCIVYTDGDTKSTGKYVERNYYEIPFRTKKEEVGNAFELKRNHFYKITATVDAPGAQTSMEPVLLEPIFYQAFPWNERTVNVGGEVSGVSFLNLSTYAIEMHSSNVHGINTNSEIKFASSTPINEVKLVRAYYVNKAGKEIANNRPYATATANALNGTITVNSTYPENVNNVIMYMTFQVTNQDGISKSFTVKQYPTVYIEGVLGYFSYRTDFGGTDLLNPGTNRHIAAQWNNNKWTYNNNYDRNNTYRTFNSKAAGTNFNNDGHVSMNYYYWTRSGNSYKIAYYTSISHYLNPRMYKVTITTTSNDYKLGRPHMDKDGYTDSSPENNQMVSPSFMIASGLGATQAMTVADAAKTHCKEYAETYRDEHGNVIRLEDWRLPTTAEIAIIAKFQQNSVAMDVVLTGNKYWSASGDPVATGVAGDSGDPKVRCVRDVYTASPTKSNQ